MKSLSRDVLHTLHRLQGIPALLAGKDVFELYTNFNKQVHSKFNVSTQKSPNNLSENRKFKGFGEPPVINKERRNKKAFQALLPEDQQQLRRQCCEILEEHEVSLAAIAWQGYQEGGAGILRVNLDPGAESPKNAQFQANWISKKVFRLLGSLTMKRFLLERSEQCDPRKSFLVIFEKGEWVDGIEVTPSLSPQKCFEAVRNREAEFGLKYRGGSN